MSYGGFAVAAGSGMRQDCRSYCSFQIIKVYEIKTILHLQVALMELRFTEMCRPHVRGLTVNFNTQISQDC